MKLHQVKVAIGDTAIVSVDLANVGNAEGTYSVTLSLDSIVLETIDVTILPETVRKVRFDVSKEDIGVYTVEVGELSGQLQVVKPAEFELSSLVVTPKEVAPGEKVTVTVDVSNTGGLEGNYICTLVVNTKVQESREVTLDSGETKTIIFTFTPSYAGGRNDIEVGELTERIKTLRPADLKVSDVSISERITGVGSSVTVTVSVHNWGNVEGTYIVVLKLDGDSAGTQSINVGGGETGTVRFTVTESDIGRHNITVDGNGNFFTVVPAAPSGYIGYTYGTFLGQGGLFIVYPEGWQERDTETADFAFKAPRQSDGFTPNFSVISKDIPYEMTVQEFFEGVRLAYGQFEGYQEVATEEITINKVPAIKHTFTTTTTSGLNVTIIQVFLIDNEMAYYLINLGTSTTTYPDFVEIFDTISNSFQLLP